MKVSRTLATAVVLGSLACGALAPITQRAQAAGPTTANTLSIGWATETKTLDPAGNPQNPDIWVGVNIYNSLLTLAPNGRTIEPALATSWTVSKDGKTYTFNLRKNVQFQDGEALTSADVKAALLRVAQKSNPWSFLYTAIKTIDTPDANTVVMHLAHPWGPFLADMTFYAGGVYPAAYLKQHGASYLAQHPVGTGPYSFVSWVKGQYILLQKNANYWDAAKYPMEYLKYELIPSDNTRLLDVEAGQLDVDNQLPYNQVAALKNSSTAVAQINASTETQYFVPNTKDAPFGDVNVRQAISHAIDRAAMTKAITYGLGTPANSYMAPQTPFYDPKLPVPTYSMALAKQYLAKSSVPHGFSMIMNTGSGDSVGNAEAQILQQELAPLGIKVTIRQMDPTTLFNDQQSGKVPGIPFTTNLWTNDIPDPDELTAFGLDYTTGSGAFFSYLNSPVATKLSQQAEQTNDPATRQQLYNQLQQWWATNLPFISLYYVPFVNAVNPKVHGFSENPLGYFNVQGVTKS